MEKYLPDVHTLVVWRARYITSGKDWLRHRNEAESMAKGKAYTPRLLGEIERLRRRNEYLEAENALLKKVKALVEEKEARLRAIGRKPSKD